MAASLLILLVGATSAFASTSNKVQSHGTGGGGLGSTPPAPKFVRWKLVDGIAVPTGPGSPAMIVNIMKAANRIAFRPYIYGGGHSYYVQHGGITDRDAGYDCSGSVSFALHADGVRGNILPEPLDSSGFESWGRPGRGKWITVYTNYEHAYMVVAGLRFDTVAAQEDVTRAWKYGDRWSQDVRAGTADTAAAFVARHPGRL